MLSIDGSEIEGKHLESSIQTDSHCISGCEKKVNAERSQALLGTTNLFRKLQREELGAKERTKAKK